ncbi:RDD family protein [Prolixibacteraceae bacterium JC049]|nr:RDD family protein [Prolixibacteraceae bacterium JC049]
MTPVNKGIRIINLAIDFTIIIIFSMISIPLLGKHIDQKLLYFITFLAYYVCFEYFKGQTIGKMLTKTKVVDYNHSQPSLFRILIRTLLRLNPFDIISYLFGTEVGSHDGFSKTTLIKEDSK